jgi:hypothetical protein
MARVPLTARILPSALAVLATLVLVLPGCGSGAAAGLGTDPAQPSVPVGERLEITLVSDDPLQSDLAWEVQDLHGGGLLGSRGRTVTYVAPASAGTYRLAVRGSRLDGSPARLHTEVRVTPVARLEPAAAALRPGAAVAFAARIKGLPRGTVAWKVEDAGGGSVTPEGLYTAPALPGTYRVTATSTEDPTVVLVATVTVN